MVTSKRKIIWPQAPLSTATASPAGAEESEGEQRQRGATDNTPDTSPLPSKPFLERGTRDTQRVAGVSAGDRPLRTRELVLGDEAQPPDPPRQGLQPARRAETRSPPPLCRGGGRSARANPHFFFFCASCHARERRQAKPRTGQTPQRPGRGPAAACARVRGGRAAPTTRRPRSRSRPLPLTCRGRPEDSYHRHLLDRELGERGLADIQPRQRAGHIVIGSHYPHRKHVRRRRHRLPSTQRPGSSGGGGLRRGASSPSSSVRLFSPPPLGWTPGRAAAAAAARGGCGGL